MSEIWHHRPETEDRIRLFRAPIRQRLARTYELCDSVTLVPAGKYAQKHGSAGFLGSSVYFVESRFTYEMSAHPILPRELVSNALLKEFILFWAFVIGDPSPLQTYEHGQEASRLAARNECPLEDHSDWGNNLEVLDPSNVRLRVSTEHTQKAYSLRDLFEKFRTTDPVIKRLLVLTTIQAHRGVPHPLYTSEILSASLTWVALDALSPRSKKSFHDRMRDELLASFPHRDAYAAIVDRLRRVRNKFLHQAVSPRTPPERVSPPDSSGARRRTVSLEETVEDYGVEGLATANAHVLLHEIVRCVLLNRIYPSLEFWPDLGTLSSYSNA